MTDRLHIDGFSIGAGGLSVGLPRAGTVDDVYGAYLHLLRLLGVDSTEPHELPRGDLELLASATRVTPDAVARRLAALRAVAARGSPEP